MGGSHRAKHTQRRGGTGLRQGSRPTGSAAARPLPHRGGAVPRLLLVGCRVARGAAGGTKRGAHGLLGTGWGEPRQRRALSHHVRTRTHATASPDAWKEAVEAQPYLRWKWELQKKISETAKYLLVREKTARSPTVLWVCSWPTRICPLTSPVSLL